MIDCKKHGPFADVEECPVCSSERGPVRSDTFVSRPTLRPDTPQDAPLAERSEPNHRFTDNVVCPHCGHEEDPTDYEIEHITKDVCSDCGQGFTIEYEYTVSIITEKARAVANGTNRATPNEYDAWCYSQDERTTTDE